VHVKGKWGYVNRNGEMIIKPRFDWGDGFSNGVAWVLVDETKIGYVDKAGRYIWKPTSKLG
jgi:hypothetical protein